MFTLKKHNVVDENNNKNFCFQEIEKGVDVVCFKNHEIFDVDSIFLEDYNILVSKGNIYYKRGIFLPLFNRPLANFNSDEGEFKVFTDILMSFKDQDRERIVIAFILEALKKFDGSPINIEVYNNGVFYDYLNSIVRKNADILKSAGVNIEDIHIVDMTNMKRVEMKSEKGVKGGGEEGFLWNGIEDRNGIGRSIGDNTGEERYAYKQNDSNRRGPEVKFRP
jgi:hypothetical protein